MNRLFSPKLLALKLVRRGVLPKYALRVSAELADHSDDISQESTENRTQIGDPDQLVEQIVDEYRQRTFAGRHPLLTFLVVPLPLTLCVLSAYLICTLLFIQLFGKADGLLAISEAIPIIMAYLGLAILPSMFTSSLICRWARRGGLSWRKTLLACLPVFIIAFVMTSFLKWSPTDGRCILGFGLWLPLGNWFGPAFGPNGWPPLPTLQQFLQLAASVLMITWMHAREIHQRRIIMQAATEGADSFHSFEDEIAPDIRETDSAA